MAEITLQEAVLPDRPGGPGWPEFVAGVHLANAIQAEQLGSTEFTVRPEQALAYAHDPYLIHRRLLAYDQDQLLGFGHFQVERGQQTGWVFVGVDHDHRRRGIGTLLADGLARIAAEEGVTVLQSGAKTTDLDTSPRLPAPTGHGDLPAESASTRFLLERRFRLGQVEVMSSLDLPVPPDRLAELSSAARPAPDYDIIGWSGPIPDDLVEGYARLRTIMSTAAPSGDLQEEEQHWDAARVRSRDRRNAEVGVVDVYSAARHRPSGELVAFTNLTYHAAADGRAIGQGATLVVPEHRGHNLGLRIKINNLRQLADHDHGGHRVVTGNAGENDAMLAINRSLGFRPSHVFGFWEKR